MGRCWRRPAMMGLSDFGGYMNKKISKRKALRHSAIIMKGARRKRFTGSRGLPTGLILHRAPPTGVLICGIQETLATCEDFQRTMGQSLASRFSHSNPLVPFWRLDIS